MVIGYIGVFFGKLIKAAVSRQREFLADASAVQFTRNPAGIAGALKKIGGLSAGSEMGNDHAGEISHVFMPRGSGTPSFRSSPRTRRLRSGFERLEPGFRGHVRRNPGRLPDSAGRGDPGGRRPAFARGTSGAQFAAGEVVAQVGTLTADGINYAAALLRALPPDSSRRPGPATVPGPSCWACCSMHDPRVRANQQKLLGPRPGATAPATVRELLPLLDSLEPRLRLPLADLAVATLRTLESRRSAFHERVEALVSADGTISLFEPMMATMIGRRLRPRLGPPDRSGERRGRAVPSSGPARSS